MVGWGCRGERGISFFGGSIVVVTIGNGVGWKCFRIFSLS